MDLMWTILIIVCVFAISAVCYKQYIEYARKKKLGLILRILLFEQVGNDKIFKGASIGYEEHDDKIASYIVIKNHKKAISGVSSGDYFPDEKHGKCLLVCKYSDDDYRVMARLREEEWFKKVQRAPQDYLETEWLNKEGLVVDVNAEDANSLRLKTIDETPIPRLDDNGEPLPDFELQSYKEPIGTTQSARETSRFNRAFSARMREKRNENEGFWSKYGTLLASVGMVMFVCIAFMYMTNKNKELVTELAATWSKEAQAAVDEMQKPQFAQRLMDYIDKDKNKDDGPPK